MDNEPLIKLEVQSDAFLWVNDLIIDLKLHLAGTEPTVPITSERLEAWREHGRAIRQCMKDAQTRYEDGLHALGWTDTSGQVHFHEGAEHRIAVISFNGEIE